MTSRYFGLLSVLFLLVSWSVFLPVNVSAQEVFTCSATANTENNSGLPATGSSDNIVCRLSGDAETSDITINVSDREIETSVGGSRNAGIYARHEGSGNIDISVSGGSIASEQASGIFVTRYGSGIANISVSDLSITTGVEGESDVEDVHGIILSFENTGSIEITNGSIVTRGNSSHGVHGWRSRDLSSTGMKADVNIKVTGASVTTEKAESHGIFGYQQHTGDINISVTEGSATTKADNSHAIYAHLLMTGDVGITVSKANIMTEGMEAYGIYGRQSLPGSEDKKGNINISFTGGSIATTGESAHGIYGHRAASDERKNNGNITIPVSGGSIATTGESAHGIYAFHDTVLSTGNIGISVIGNATITTEKAGSHGIYVHHKGLQAPQEDTEDTLGDKIAVGLSGGSISTTGDESHGIHVNNQHPEEGKISITTRNSHTITTEGANAHGIVVYNDGIGPSEVIVENITANGVGAYGIQFGRLNEADEIDRVPAASVDDDDTRQLVDSEGYQPLSVRINGTVMGGEKSEDEDGTHGAGVFMAGGGRVTIGSKGVLGAQSGIAILAAGVNPTEEDTSTEENATPRKLYVNLVSLDGKPWERLDGRIVNEGGETILAMNGMDVFDNNPDYEGEDRRTNHTLDVWIPYGPLNEIQLNPDGDFNMLDFTQEEDWMRRYQAHAGAYEALPGAIRRIDTMACYVPTQQNFIGVCGGRGQYTPDQTTTGMSYSYDQQAVHGHITAALSDRSSGWIGLRQVNGEANVSIASGSSRLKMRGFGMYGGLHVMGDNDLYGQAQLMGTRYRSNLSSGPVSAATKGMAWSFALEGGRHFSVDDETRVTGRGWLKQSNVSVNPFRSTDNLLVIARERQVIAGLGVRAERTMALASETSRVVLRGSAGIENAVNEASGATIGDAALESQAKATRFLLDLGGALYQGNTTVQGMVYAHGLGADDTAYGLRLGLEWSF